MTINNAGEAFRLQHGGLFYDIPTGFSDLPDDVAKHAQRKFVMVRIQHPQGELPPALRVTVTPQPVDVDGNLIPTPKPGEWGGEPLVKSDDPETQPQTPAEVQPEQPAAPIEGESEQTPVSEPPAEAQE